MARKLVAPTVSVLDKRLSGSSPFAMDSIVIPLKEAGWVTYIGNGGRSSNRLWQLVNVKGWIPVTVADLACKPSDFGYTTSPEGFVVTGAGGQEAVFKMRVEDWTRLQAAKTAANNRTIGDSRRVKAELVGAAEKQFGDEAASYIHEHATGEVRDWRAPEDQGALAGAFDLPKTAG